MESGPENKGMARVEQMCDDRSRRARELRSQGYKIIGYFCCAPVELITAAGLIPYRITGDMQAQVTRADAHVETIACPFVRSAFDIAIKGGYDFLDGFVIPHGCDSTERIYEIWNYHFKPTFSHFINIPHTTTRPSCGFAKEEFRTFQRSLERLTGKKILPEGIKEAIRVHNQNRSLVRELYELRKPAPPLLSGAETMKVVLADKSLPVEESNEMLASILREIRQRPRGPEKKPVRTMIYGSELDGSSVLKTSKSRSGSYGEYHKINNYIYTFLNSRKDGKKQARVRFRKNPGFKLIKEAWLDPIKKGRDYRLTIVIQGARMRFYVDGRLVVDHRDENKPHRKGHHAFRTWRTHMSADVFRVSRIVEAKEKKQGKA